jgi:hypothetical protein
MDVNIATFEAQQFASKVLLFLVVFVVIAGIAFSGFQLWKSVTAGGVQGSSEMEVSASRVRVTSSVVGVIVLAISLAFLYIYASHIYEIKTISAINNLLDNSSSK